MGLFDNTEIAKALKIRKEGQRRKKSRSKLLQEQIANEKRAQNMLAGINNVCGIYFQSPDVNELIFYVEDKSRNEIVKMLSMDKLFYKYRVDGNMLHVYSEISI